MTEFIQNICNTLKSILNDVVYLDIETTGIDPVNSEVIEVGVIKVEAGKLKTFNTFVKNKKEVPIEIYSQCKGITKSNLECAPNIQEVESELKKFIKDYTIIFHDTYNYKRFLNYYFPNLENKIIDSKELATVLEPYHREFTLDYLKKEITKENTEEKNRALYDALDILKIVNALIIRLKKKKNQL